MKGLKEPARHSDIYKLACASIDQLANDKEKPLHQITAELTTIESKCRYRLAGLLTEAITGKDLSSRGLRIRKKKISS